MLNMCLLSYSCFASLVLRLGQKQNAFVTRTQIAEPVYVLLLLLCAW